MLEKGKINPGEFQILIIAFCVGSTILIPPAYLAEIAKQDAWIATVLAILLSPFLIYIYNQLAALHPSMTYVEYNEKILGKWLGKMISLLYLYYIYHLTAGALREMGDFLTTEVLVETPIQIIMIIFLLTSLIGVRLGIEVITRTAVIFFPWIVILLCLLFLFLTPNVKFVNLQPIFEGGMKPILKGSYVYLGHSFLELSIFLMITPYVSEKAKMKKAFYKGTLIGGWILTLIVICCILVLGSYLTARQAYPAYMLGKKIIIGTFIQRVEVIVAIIWMLTLYFKLTICFYALSLGLAQFLRLKNYKILTFPLAFLIITFSIFFHPNIVHLYNFLVTTWPTFSFTVCFFLPMLLLLIGKIQTKKTPDIKASK